MSLTQDKPQQGISTNDSPKDFINTAGKPLKKCFQVNSIVLVPIDKSIVEKLAINDKDTFLEQEITEDGILMRILHFQTDLK